MCRIRSRRMQNRVQASIQRMRRERHRATVAGVDHNSCKMWLEYLENVRFILQSNSYSFQGFSASLSQAVFLLISGIPLKVPQSAVRGVLGSLLPIHCAKSNLGDGRGVTFCVGGQSLSLGEMEKLISWRWWGTKVDGWPWVPKMNVFRLLLTLRGWQGVTFDSVQI